MKSAPPSRPHLLGAGLSAHRGDGRTPALPPTFSREGRQRPCCPFPCDLRGGGGHSAPFFLADPGVPRNGGGAVLPPGPASVLPGRCRPGLPDRAGRGRDPFFSPWAKVRVRDWILENYGLLPLPHLGVLIELTPKSALSLRLEMSFLREMPMLREARVNSTAQIPCSSRSTLTRVHVSGYFCNPLLPPSDLSNKGTRFG